MYLCVFWCLDVTTADSRVRIRPSAWPAVPFNAVVLLLLIHCLLLLPLLWGSFVFGHCFVANNLVSFLVL